MLKGWNWFNRIVLVFGLPGLALAACSMPLSAQTAPGPGAPNTLRCEYMEDPLGVDTTEPRFQWVLEHSDRAEKQTAYQVLVATRAELLNQDRGDQWDSGKVTNDDFTQVAYAGKALDSGRSYFWKVRYWDKEGRPSAWSQLARFGTALLKSSDWKASWVAAGAQGGEFRKEFTVQGKVTNARIYVAALGYYELRVNGKRIGHKVLDPAWTTYPKRVLYSTYDLDPVLKEGKNVIAVMLAGGWATSGSGWVAGLLQRNRHSLVQMNAELEGGKQLSVTTDNSWKTAPGPVVESSVYGGEVYDARQETRDGSAGICRKTGWTAAR
jgi:alpha-L-rhamnosidase